MLKLLTAYTREADNPRKAVKEIVKQLDFEREKRAHSVALLFCYTDFVVSGVAEAVCKSLPCEVVGCTSQYFAIGNSGCPALPGAADEIMLTLVVLTSDDVAFATKLSAPLTADNAAAELRSLYHEACAAAGEPSLIFAFQPTMFDLGCDVPARALNQVCGDIPVFGTSALDVGQKIRNPRTIYHGAAYVDRMILLLFNGPVSPRFFFSPFPETAIFAQDAVITGARGNRIFSINNLPATFFLEEIGLMQDRTYKSASPIPLIIDNHDGTLPRVVVVSDINAEGQLICSQSVRTGDSLSVGAVNAEQVLESTAALVREITGSGDGAGVFIFPCFMRNVILGGNSLAEIDLIRNAFAGRSCPFLICYSGGELCPQSTGAGVIENQFYQFAIIACQL
jgi:hypothetical protein